MKHNFERLNDQKYYSSDVSNNYSFRFRFLGADLIVLCTYVFRLYCADTVHTMCVGFYKERYVHGLVHREYIYLFCIAFYDLYDVRLISFRINNNIIPILCSSR